MMTKRFSFAYFEGLGKKNEWAYSRFKPRTVFRMDYVHQHLKSGRNETIRVGFCNLGARARSLKYGDRYRKDG